MEKRFSDKPADESSEEYQDKGKTSELEEETDEFFGGVVEEEDLNASETDENADEGVGDGEIGRKRNEFPDK